jgi:uncharacterized protein
VRVRAHAGGTVARLEVPETVQQQAFEHRDELERLVRDSGFTFVALDLAPYRSGRLNALLPLAVR